MYGLRAKHSEYPRATPGDIFALWPRSVKPNTSQSCLITNYALLLLYVLKIIKRNKK